jgi:hypothetical protein
MVSNLFGLELLNGTVNNHISAAECKRFIGCWKIVRLYSLPNAFRYKACFIDNKNTTRPLKYHHFDWRTEG